MRSLVNFHCTKSNPFFTAKHATYALNGMVATSQALAAQAGLDILKKGGNAIDAAIATAACLTVVEPTSNGIGGDAFALVWTKGKLHGINGSGRAPKAISIDLVKEKGHEEMPKYGWFPVTVPGAPGLWAELSNRFGKLSLLDVLQPAIQYAKNGYPVSPTLAKYWNFAYKNYKVHLQDSIFAEWFHVFAPEGRAPKIGEVWASPDHAKTLEEIGKTNAESFYRGELTETIVRFSKETGGFFELDDFAEYKPEWVEPIHVNYRGYDVWEIPPNGQGIVALEALNILKGFEFASLHDVDTVHKQIEAIKLAFSDAKHFVTDREHMQIKPEDLLSDVYADKRRSLIGEKAMIPKPGKPQASGTVYLATADAEGNMVSFIQSNYMGFGSGLVVPGTGIALQNRGNNFSLDPNHVNALQGGKRTYHTIIPGFLTKDHQPIGPFGVMGGFMQPQGHVQVIMNTIDFGLDPQSALDAPRWQWMQEKIVAVENRFPHHLAQDLRAMGHDIRIELEPNTFGRGQIIWRNPETGVFVGGTDTRTDGVVAAW